MISKISRHTTDPKAIKGVCMLGEKLAKLIDVKSIMTLLLTVVFCVLALSGVVSGQEFTTIFTVIVGFYFGTQSQKQGTAEENKSR